MEGPLSTGPTPSIFFIDLIIFVNIIIIYFFVSMPLSEHVQRISVSCRQDKQSPYLNVQVNFRLSSNVLGLLLNPNGGQKVQTQSDIDFFGPKGKKKVPPKAKFFCRS